MSKCRIKEKTNERITIDCDDYHARDEMIKLLEMDEDGYIEEGWNLIYMDAHTLVISKTEALDEDTMSDIIGDLIIAMGG